MSGSTNGPSGPDPTTANAQPDPTTQSDPTIANAWRRTAAANARGRARSRNPRQRILRDPNYTSDQPGNMDSNPERADNQTSGYEMFSEYLDGAIDLLHFRRFGKLNARALLFMQWRLAQMEQALNRMDYGGIEEDELPPQRNDSFLLNSGTDREEMMEKIVEELDKYNKYMINYGIIRGRKSSPEDELITISSWQGLHMGLTHHGKNYSELDYVTQKNQKYDVVPLVPKEHSPLRSWFWKQEWLTGLPFWSFELSTGRISHGGRIRAGIYNNFIDVISYVVGLALILIPLWWLNYVEEREKRLAIITAFVTGFCFLLAIVNPLGTFQNIGIAAAYAGVLLNFLDA